MIDTDERNAAPEESLTREGGKLLLERHKTECREEGPLHALAVEMSALREIVTSMRANFKAWLIIAGIVVGPAVTFALTRMFPPGENHRAIPMAQAASKAP